MPTASILDSVKESLGGIPPTITNFDSTLIYHINSAFNVLNQLGVGPITPYKITNSSATWNDFVTSEDIEMIKPYIFMKVKLAFDPPSQSFVLESLKNQISEYEWRLNVAEDHSLPTS